MSWPGPPKSTSSPAPPARAEWPALSIPTKAFRGEFVPTKADVARQETRDYEPASVLLERIKREGEGPPESRARTAKGSADFGVLSRVGASPSGNGAPKKRRRTKATQSKSPILPRPKIV